MGEVVKVDFRKRPRKQVQIYETLEQMAAGIFDGIILADTAPSEYVAPPDDSA
jgi:hypothetical protein